MYSCHLVLGNRIEGLKNYIKNIDLSKNDILVKLDVIMPDGVSVSEHLRLNNNNIENILKLIDNMGYEIDEDLGYEIGKISNFATVTGITLIDINLLPNNSKNNRKRISVSQNPGVQLIPIEIAVYLVAPTCSTPARAGAFISHPPFNSWRRHLFPTSPSSIPPGFDSHPCLWAPLFISDPPVILLSVFCLSIYFPP